MKRVVIIGGGAGGMLAAGSAAEHGAKVVLLERNNALGRKLRISGKGRGNVTNIADIDDLVAAFGPNGKFLYGAFSRFSNHDLIALLERLGVPTKIERGGRAFPRSDRAADVVSALEAWLRGLKVDIRLGSRALGLEVHHRDTEAQRGGGDGETGGRGDAENGGKGEWGKGGTEERSTFNAQLSASNIERRTPNIEPSTINHQPSTINHIRGVRVFSGVVPSDAVVLATGGITYPKTGSTGDGYRMAAEVGHTTVPPRPSLSALEVGERWVSQLQGLSLKNVSATLYVDGKKVAREFGEMLFTHFGVSGPIVLTLSKRLAEVSGRDGEGEKGGKGEREKGRKGEGESGGMGAMESESPVPPFSHSPTLPHSAPVLSLNLKPAVKREELDERLVRDFTQTRHFRNYLTELLPRTLIPVFMELSGIPADQPVNRITAAQRKRILDLLLDLRLTVKGARAADEAIVTAGGVSISEIDPRTMESKLVHGLYLVGEVIDIDAVTGGYNLQAAFSTGWVAGESAALRG